jgi:hypothetical protein
LSVDETWGIVGRRCVAATRLVHQLRGEQPTPGCALEILWDTGEVSALDENTDLTLSVSSTPWRDPYADCDEAQLERLADEVGLWTRRPVGAGDALAPIIGETATDVEPLFNQVMELAGIRIRFDSVVLTAEVVMDSLLRIELSPL